MYDPTTVYRTAQVATAGPVGQVVLLYQGAIRFSTAHLAALRRRDIEAAHHTSTRAQAIVSGLREVLDLSAGPLAANLDALYDFVLDRLVAGNVAKDPRPTEEALTVLQGLLEAWHEIARGPAAEADQPEPPPGNVLPGQPAGHSTPSPTAPLGVPGLTAGVAGLSGVA